MEKLTFAGFMFAMVAINGFGASAILFATIITVAATAVLD